MKKESYGEYSESQNALKHQQAPTEPEQHVAICGCNIIARIQKATALQASHPG